MKKPTVIIVSVITIGIVLGLYLLGFKYGYSSLQTKYLIIPAVIIGFFLIVAALLIIIFLVDIIKSSRGVKKQSSLYDEIRLILRNTLIPLGFNEHEQNVGWIMTVEFLRDKYLVRLGCHIADGDYILVASSKGDVDEEGKEIYDISVNGDKANGEDFKTQASANLKAWLIKMNLK